MSQIHSGGDNSSGDSTVDFLTGNTGGPVGPDSNNNINIVGTGGVTVSGNAGDNTLTISVSGSGFTWTDESTSFNALSENAYFITAAATATLPAGASIGSVIKIVSATNSNVVLQAAAGDTIRIGVTASTVAGTATASNIGNSITIVYDPSTTTWYSDGGPEGTWILA